MAKKKEKELSYLQSPLPEGQKYYKTTKVSFSGLNKRNTLDTGVLSYEKNISTVETPYLTPAQRPYLSLSGIQVISMFGFDDFLVIVHKKDGKIYISYADDDGIYATGVLVEDTTDEDTGEKVQRSIVQFNVYESPYEKIADVMGNYNRKLLIFPDKMSLDFNVERNYTTPTALSVDPLGKGIPNIKYATVHLSRIFGLDDGRVYASGFNDYANWNLDTAEEYKESNAWCSPAQANVKADSTFTGITTFQNHVVCFKRNFMHEIYNTKNPFRIQDIYAEGAIDNRTIQDVDGRLVFVSDDYVKVYTGSNPQIISYELDIPKYTHAISGNDGRNYYLYVESGENKHFFVYDTLIGEWSERSLLVPNKNDESGTFNEVSEIKAFASNKNGMYMATEGAIYKLNSGDYTDVPWAFETDIVTNNTVDIKHIKKIQMLCDFDKADVDVYILYGNEEFKDSDDDDEEQSYHKVYSKRNLTGRATIRVKPRMTAHYGFRLRFEGKGYVKLYNLEISAQQGGELFV